MTEFLILSLITSNHHKKSSFTPISSENFSWRWLSSNFTVPARFELCLQTCVGYSDMLRLCQPVRIIMRKIWIWTLITSNHHKKSFFKPTSSEISHEDHYHLLLKCLPGWILSPYMHLSSLTCSDGANRLGIIMTKFLFWVWLQAMTTRNRLSSQSPLKISHEDDYHLLLQCLPGWIMSPNMRWVFWHAQIGPTGLELSWGKSEFGLWLQATTTRNHLSSRPPLKFLMRIIIIYF